MIPIEVTSFAPAGRPAEAGDWSVSGLGTGGTLTFASGESSKTFTVTANHDTDDDVEDVELDFGTLPDGVTSPRAGELYRAFIRILDEDYMISISVREDQPSDRPFLSPYTTDPDMMRDIVWWLEGPDARYFRITSDGAPPNRDYARISLRESTVLDPDVKLKYSFDLYFSNGAESSGDEVGCSQATPTPCRPDSLTKVDITISRKPAITVDPASFPANETTDATLTLTNFQTPHAQLGDETVTFTVNSACSGFLEFATTPPVIMIDTTGADTVPVSLTVGNITGSRRCAIVATGSRLHWGRFDTAEAPLSVNGPPPVNPPPEDPPPEDPPPEDPPPEDPPPEDPPPEPVPALPGSATAILAAILLLRAGRRVRP